MGILLCLCRGKAAYDAAVDRYPKGINSPVKNITGMKVALDPEHGCCSICFLFLFLFLLLLPLSLLLSNGCIFSMSCLHNLLYCLAKFLRRRRG